MSARFILSLDCEGKWGVADHLNDGHRSELGDEPLRRAYGSIVQLLDEFGIPATFAFVGAFTQSASDFSRIRAAIEDMARSARDYLGPALQDLDETGGDGWHGDCLLDLVKSARMNHEIALHGVTHVPWTRLDEAAAASELALARSLAGPVATSRTFVFPRNLVAHSQLLGKHGFAGFRAAREQRSRVMNFLSEFNLFEQPEWPKEKARTVTIPAGFFLNWRHGPRALVPPVVTQLRIRRLLHAAAASRAVVHYWLHPENIASAPATLEVLRMLAREVAKARDAGHCETMTQLGYCRGETPEIGDCQTGVA